MIYRLSNEKIDALIESRGAQLISLRDKAGCEFVICIEFEPHRMI